MAADFFFTSNLFYLVSVIFFKQKDFPDFCKITTKLLIKLLLLSSVPVLSIYALKISAPVICYLFLKFTKCIFKSNPVILSLAEWHPLISSNLDTFLCFYITVCEILQVWFHCILRVSPHWFSNKLYIKLFVVKISHLTGYKDKYLDKLTD